MFAKSNRYIFSYEKKRKAATLKRTSIIGSIVLVLALLLFGAFWIYNSAVHIELEPDRTVPINTPATASSFVMDMGNSTLIEDQEIDTSTVGTKDCLIKVKVMDEVRDFPFKVTVVDTEPPVINLEETTINMLAGTDYDLMSKVQATDNSGETINVLTEGEYDLSKPGTNLVRLIAKDSSGNTTQQEVTINVVNLAEDLPDMTFLTPTGHTARVHDGLTVIGGVLIVNKAFGLPPTYGDGMKADAQEAFDRMVADAAAQGLYLDVNTGFRSYEEQEQLFDYYAYYLEEGENTNSTMRPGHSEHQTGLAYDVNYTSYEFAYSPEGIWLYENCSKYGFALRYPEDKTEITGCDWEPWHVRYVGENVSKELYKDGTWITLEEYFGIPSDYPTNKVDTESSEEDAVESEDDAA